MSTFIQITEVGPRDGFQNIKTFIPTDLKIKIIDRLVEAGIGAMEITSMVSPKAIPQMRDAREVIQHVLTAHPHIIPSVLVPNVKGASLASEAGIKNINYVVSVSPAHNKANINRTHAESLEDLYNIRHTFTDMTITLSLATVFGCPFIGETSHETLMDMIKFADDLGISAITLCDTIGVANPTQTLSVLRGIQQKFPKMDIGLHLHNTHGMALACMFVGVQSGITRFETAVGGLGGCPFAPGAAGNAATEDAVNMFNRMGLDTGISLPDLLEIANLIRSTIEPTLLSSLSRARTYGEFDFCSEKI
ncbi:hydroxymethylglutaryl-CoA lyase [Citrobacter farmeri]|uniref:hydroxymethylglutaryl-CoA lyase n=1 Tax=Citrobacter farmeri TaxID=67824 RepID=UPI001903C585|nr:hydroxymethylglutaryl-CoA lyase [Citrobacter farmeri]MBJ9162942.1 hydroxymethylglutaryl-CoA lyase [Citrobacter farmeri]